MTIPNIYRSKTERPPNTFRSFDRELTDPQASAVIKSRQKRVEYASLQAAMGVQRPPFLPAEAENQSS